MPALVDSSTRNTLATGPTRRLLASSDDRFKYQEVDGFLRISTNHWRKDDQAYREIELSKRTYDSDESDFSDALEEARRIGGMYYYRMLLSSYLQRTGHITWEVLKAITPRPRATQMPEGGSNGITVLGNGRRTVKRFIAPRGKRKYSHNPSIFQKHV